TRGEPAYGRAYGCSKPNRNGEGKTSTSLDGRLASHCSAWLRSPLRWKACPGTSHRAHSSDIGANCRNFRSVPSALGVSGGERSRNTLGVTMDLAACVCMSPGPPTGNDVQIGLVQSCNHIRSVCYRSEAHFCASVRPG